MFKKLDGDIAMLYQGGVYKTAELYEWQGKLFAKASGGYVRIRENGTTSKDGVRLEHLEIEVPLYSDKFGRLCLEWQEGYRSIAVTSEGTLEVLQIAKAT